MGPARSRYKADGAPRPMPMIALVLQLLLLLLPGLLAQSTTTVLVHQLLASVILLMPGLLAQSTTTVLLTTPPPTISGMVVRVKINGVYVDIAGCNISAFGAGVACSSDIGHDVTVTPLDSTGSPWWVWLIVAIAGLLLVILLAVSLCGRADSLRQILSPQTAYYPVEPGFPPAYPGVPGRVETGYPGVPGPGYPPAYPGVPGPGYPPAYPGVPARVEPGFASARVIGVAIDRRLPERSVMA
jgi:hypothetical protein